MTCLLYSNGWMQLVNLPDCSTNSRYNLYLLHIYIWLSCLYVFALTLSRAFNCRLWKIQSPSESPSPSVREVNWNEARNFGLCMSIMLWFCWFWRIFYVVIDSTLFLTREMLHRLTTYWMRKAGSWRLRCFLMELHPNSQHGLLNEMFHTRNFCQRISLSIVKLILSYSLNKIELHLEKRFAVSCLITLVTWKVKNVVQLMF